MLGHTHDLDPACLCNGDPAVIRPLVRSPEESADEARALFAPIANKLHALVAPLDNAELSDVERAWHLQALFSFLTPITTDLERILGIELTPKLDSQAEVRYGVLADPE